MWCFPTFSVMNVRYSGFLGPNLVPCTSALTYKSLTYNNLIATDVARMAVFAVMGSASACLSTRVPSVKRK